MMLSLLTAWLLFSCLNDCVVGSTQHWPRIIFTEKETTVNRAYLPEGHAALPIILEETLETVIVAGQRSLNSYNFQNPVKTVESNVWNCSNNVQQDCNYNITMMDRRKDNQVFVCGSNGRQTICCNMNLSAPTPMCHSSPETEDVEKSIEGFVVNKDHPYALVESGGNSMLFIAYSGSEDIVGIHKFGKDKVRPPYNDKEQHYVGLIPVTHSNNSVQDKLYGFYKEKNTDTEMYSDKWIPFVTRVCMADVGGPKNMLQFSWTSRMNARLYCGDPDSKQRFSELVNVATVHAERWQDTRVYALFRNEWGMSAVCVYSLQDIDSIFATSPFKNDINGNINRPRVCVDDSKRLPVNILKMVEKTSEMKEWVQPVNNSGPLLFNHYHYTHIYVDSSQHRGNNVHAVLFLSLNNGRIHKVMHSRIQTLVIAEYRPFNHQADIFSLILHPASRKLYVESRSELVQLDVANCAQYGDNCEECVLARDPYCGWKGTKCIPETQGTLQDVDGGNYKMCSRLPKKEFRHSFSTHPDKGVNSVILPAQAKYFLQCPVSSHHAQYTWIHHEKPISCSSKEQNCLFLIDSMGHKQEGTYKCVSEEMGYTKVLAQYKLQLENKATGRSSSSLIWVCLMAVLIKSSSC